MPKPLRPSTRPPSSTPPIADGWSGLAFAASRTDQPSITLHALTMRSKFLPEVPATYFLWATAYDTLHQRAAAATYYHHFLDAAAGKFPDQEWQARQRLLLLENKSRKTCHNSDLKAVLPCKTPRSASWRKSQIFPLAHSPVSAPVVTA